MIGVLSDMIGCMSENETIEEQIERVNAMVEIPSDLQLEPGQRVLRNGAIYDQNAGRIVGAVERPAEYYNELQRVRKRKYQQATEQGIIQASKRTTPTDAWAWLTEQQAKIASGTGKEAVMAYQAIYKSLGLNDNLDRNEASQPAVTMSAAAVDLMRELADIIREQQASKQASGQ